MENWNDAMWAMQDAVGKYTWPFFYTVVGFVNICLLNLFPAVMSFNLRKARGRKKTASPMTPKRPS